MEKELWDIKEKLKASKGVYLVAFLNIVIQLKNAGIRNLSLKPKKLSEFVTNVQSYAS